MQIPKVRGVVSIPDDPLRKCILLKADSARDNIDSYVKEHGYEITDEKVILGYDNMSMSKYLIHSDYYRR